MKKTGAQHVLFADVVQKINRQGKAQPRVLLLTERSLHTLTPGKFKQGNCVPLGDVTKLSMSTYADGYMVVHVKEGAKDCKADLLFESMRKAEIATAISETEALGPDFTFAFADEICFRSKKPPTSSATRRWWRARSPSPRTPRSRRSAPSPS